MAKEMIKKCPICEEDSMVLTSGEWECTECGYQEDDEES